MILIGVVVFALLLSGCNAQAKPKSYRVGVLSGLDFFANTFDGFKAGMAELGYIEGENIVYDVQKTGVDLDAYRSVIRSLWPMRLT